MLHITCTRTLFSLYRYDVYAPLGAFFFPLLLIVACYSFIFFHLWCKMRHKAAREQRRSEIERRMTLVSTSAGATHNHNRNRVRSCGGQSSSSRHLYLLCIDYYNTRAAWCAAR